jgi:hypothetical protein
MKKNIFILTVSLCVIAVLTKAQIVFSENFTATSTPIPSGWLQQNNSVPLGTGTWFQGNGTIFPSFNGGGNDYLACNYNSQGSGTGGTSNFLITPTVNLVNGATFYFVTRKEGVIGYPDRLQLLMSQGSGTGAIASGTSAVGSFTTTLLDINSNLTNNGYPVTWSAFTGTVTGITGTVVGRFAFRYFFDNGGSSGTNGSYIGIDSVAYALPCAQSVFSISPTSTAICSGESVLLTAVTTLTNAPTSYTWNNGQNGASTIVSPQTTTNFTLNAQNSIGCVGQRTLTIVVHPTPTINLAASVNTVCLGENLTITASGASVYAWSGAAVSNSSAIIYFSPSPGLKSFFVVGTSSAGCVSNASISLLVHPTPAVNATVSKDILCAGLIATVSATGADTYSWAGSSSAGSPSFPYAAISAGVKTFTVLGTSTLTGCSAIAATSFTVLDCAGFHEDNTNGGQKPTVYPNPFKDEIYFSEAPGRVEVYTVSGKLILKESGDDMNKINTSRFEEGLYTLKIFNIDGNLIKTTRLIKN